VTSTRLRVGGLIIAIVAVGTTVSATAVQVRADTAVSAPFTWQGDTWCPTYRGGNGCDNVQQNGTNSSVPFYPSQVTNTGSPNQIMLRMNSAATETGAFDTQTYETWRAPTTLSEQINLPCNSAGQIDNWPAFWLVTAGSWPAGGEIDVMEGLHGSAAWHYHYLNSSGVDSSVGGAVSGFRGCGTHTYGVNWTTSAITFYYDGIQVGRVTAAEIGVPLASGPMYVVNDYAASSTYGGPTTGNVGMEILNFTP
jgi:Glycosyl hydrolases family 16